MTTTRSQSLNGINWMLTNNELLAEAAANMAQQCPVTAKTLCINLPDPEVDTVRAAWDEGHGITEAMKAGRAELLPRELREESEAPKPVPIFQNIVRQQEQLLVGHPDLI